MEKGKTMKDFAVSSLSGISSVTPLEVKNEGHPMRRKKEGGDLKGRIQKAGPRSGEKVSLVTSMTTAIAESKKWKSN